jgi:hypothetical protein
MRNSSLTEQKRRNHVTVLNEVEKNEVFRDHFKECLAHFAARFNANYPPGRKGLTEARQPMADFCGVSKQTISRWLSATGADQTVPVGEAEIRATCLLNLNGYRIIEFERLPKVIRNFAELIGFGVISTERGSQLLGYERAQEIYCILRQEVGIAKEKESKMWEVWKEHRDELERRKREVIKSCRFEFLIQNPASKSIQTPLELVPVSNGIPENRRAAVLTILEGALQLLEEGLFNELSEMELAALRESRHGGTILQLSAYLNALSLKLITGKKGE